MTLDQLSAAATQGAFEAQAPDVENDFGVPIIATNYPGTYGPSNGLVLWATMLPTEIGDKDTRRAQANTAFVVALVNAYRTGHLVAVSDDVKAALVRARDKALDEAANACEAHMKQFLDDNDVRKMWPATQARNDVYAGIIRALKSRKGTGDE